jgi:hypothetical protein
LRCFLVRRHAASEEKIDQRFTDGSIHAGILRETVGIVISWMRFSRDRCNHACHPEARRRRGTSQQDLAPAQMGDVQPRASSHCCRQRGNRSVLARSLAVSAAANDVFL